MNIINDFEALDSITNSFKFSFKAQVGQYLIKLTKEKAWHHDTPDYEYEIIDTKTGNYYQNSGRDTKNSPNTYYASLPSTFKTFKTKKNIISFLETKQPNSKLGNIEKNSLYLELKQAELKANKTLVTKTINSIKEKRVS